jgi:hypothetical protein
MCWRNWLGTGSSSPASFDEMAQSSSVRYCWNSVMPPNQRVPFSFAIVTTFGISHGPKQPLIESWMHFNKPLARHSFFSHSTGTAGLPFAVFPQQQPWQTLTCPSTSRFVTRGNFSIHLSSLGRHGFPFARYWTRLRKDSANELIRRRNWRE